jgi:arylformamidase
MTSFPKTPPWRACYDISVSLGREDATYPGDPVFSSRPFAEYADAGFLASQLTLSAHAGAHLDAPRHFFPQGKSLDQYPPERFLPPALVIPVSGPRVLAQDILDAETNDAQGGLGPGQAALFQTNNSRSGLPVSGAWTEDYAALSAEAAELLVQRQVGLVGLDYLSVDPADAHEYPAHRRLLENDILILEGVTLAAVPPGRYTLVCLPLKIADSEAAPTRAILLQC